MARGKLRLVLGQILILASGVTFPSVVGRNQVEQSPYSRGLALWRKPDKLGRACASCHSPDGIELAAYGYDEATIRRRATPHLGPDSARQLGRYIVELRRRAGFRAPLDPMKARPMQPGASVLPGGTPEALDRAFALSLNRVTPRLVGARIGTLAEAKRALSEVLRLDPSRLRVGIQMNRLSEDKFHGDEHASLAHWIPDLAPLPYTGEFQQAQDRYLSTPSDEHLHELETCYSRAWTRELAPAQAIALEKARCLLLLQHRLRTGRMVVTMRQIPDPNQAPPNPFWEIGDLARIYTNLQAGGLALPPDVAANKRGGPSLSSQLRDMRLPWLWLGWIADPGLQRTSFERRTRYADWFTELLLEDGPYPAHAALMLVKRMATAAFDKSAWGSVEPQHVDINFSWLLRGDNWRLYTPKDRRHREALYRFLANAFRMFALLQADEIRRTGVTYLRDPVLQQIRSMREASAVMDPKHAPEDRALFDRDSEAIQKARWLHY